MEYVFVRYTGDRKVLVDEQIAGVTNKTLRVEAGHHIFALDGPEAYQPPTVERSVLNTTSEKPLVIGDFHPE